MVKLNNIYLLKKWLSRQVCSDDYRIFKLFLLHSKREENNFSIFKERLKTFFRIIKMPIYLKIEVKDTDNIVYGSTDNIKIKNYIEHYDKKNNLFFLSDSILEPIYIKSTSDIFRFFKNYSLVIRDLLFLLIMFNKISTKELSYFLYLKVKILQYNPKKLYLISTHNINSNLLTFFSTNCLKIDTDFVIGAMNMQARYAYYNNVRLCYISKIVRLKQESFMKIGWTKVENTQVLISGNMEQIIKKENIKDFLYDVGMYSSGIWARNGLARSYNIDEIKKNKEHYRKDIYAKIEMIILTKIVEMAKKYNFTLKIYLHPYEKEIIKKYNIYPPFWNFKDLDNIYLDADLLIKNDFFETKIGIVMLSTIFQDRWNDDLYTLCFDPKNKKKIDHIKLKYLGKYKNYGFRNLKELEQKILENLNK